MKLRTQLSLAFLLFAVLPLAAVTFYSYSTSTKVLERAAEAEAAALTEGMGARMQRAIDELGRRVDDLRRRSRR
jgi:hypothetical protein